MIPYRHYILLLASALLATASMFNFLAVDLRAAELTSVRPRASFDPKFEEVGGVINTLAPASGGKFYATGAFTYIGGIERTALARLNADGTIDASFVPSSAIGSVSRFVVSTDQKLIFLGSLTLPGQDLRTGLFRLTSDGAIDPSFVPPTTNAQINKIAVQSDGRIVIVGAFATVNGIARARIARLLSDGSVDLTFDPGAGPNQSPEALAIQSDGAILIGGSFSTVNGIPRARLARLFATGVLDESFDSGTGPDFSLQVIAIDSAGRILVGGLFNSFNSAPAQNVVRLQPNGIRDESFAPGSDALRGGVTVIAVQPDDSCLVGGRLSAYNNGQVETLARITASGALDATFVAPPIESVNSVGVVQAIAVQGDGRILLGGAFDSYGVVAPNLGGTPRHGILRLESTGAVDATYSPELRRASEAERVHALPDNAWLVTGDFAYIDGVARRGVARINADGSLDLTFDPAPLFDQPPLAFAVASDGEILAAGNFTTFNGSAAGRIVRLNADGSRDSSFDSGTGFNNSVARLAVQADGKIIASGGFTAYSGVTRNHLARLESTGALDLAFDPGSGFSGYQTAMAVHDDGKIVVVGSFTQYNDSPRRDIVQILPNGAVDPAFDPGTTFQYAFGAASYLLAQSDGKTLLGSTSFIGQPVGGSIARVNANGSVDSTFTPLAAMWIFSGPFGPREDNGKFFAFGMPVSPMADNFIWRLDAAGADDTSFIIPSATAFFYATAGAFDASGNLAVAGQWSPFTSFLGRGLVLLEPTGEPAITSALEASATYGTPFSYTITGSENPTSFAAMGLPPGLSVDTATGIISGAPTAAGYFPVELRATNVNGSGTRILALLVDRISPTIVLGNTTQSYNGQPRAISVSTVPAGLDASITYYGGPANEPPTEPGEYSVWVRVDTPVYFGEVNATLTVEKATALISFDQTVFPYNGSSRFVFATTVPAGLGTITTFDFSETAPHLQGTYTIRTTVVDPYYDGFATGTLHITPPITPVQPGPVQATAGSETTLEVTYGGGSGVTYQWQVERPAAGASANSHPESLQWLEIPGATESKLTISTTQRFNAGSYRVIVTEGELSIPSDPIEVTVAAPPPSTSRLLNLSTRGLAGADANQLFPGFVVSGSGTKKLLIRAVGPSLGDLGVPFATLPDPRMELKRFNFVTQAYEDLETNDDWGTNTNAAAITTTAAQVFAFPYTDPADAALLVDLPAGQYAVVGGDKDGTSAIGMVELYDADVGTPSATLINISNRGFCGVGDSVMIPGFVISSEGPKTLLVRVVGPTLGGAPYNVPGTMTDPKLEIYPSGANVPILANDNWGDNPDAAYTAQIAQQVSAFPLAAGSADAAFVVTLPPGGYTIVGSSAFTGGTGVVLVEVYVVP